jgi:hypothetical protein
MSDISVIADESATEVFSEPTIKVSDNQTSSSASSVLNGVVAFVDVRTGEGDDSGMIFVDMLKGMGARVSSRNFLSKNVLTSPNVENFLLADGLNR